MRARGQYRDTAGGASSGSREKIDDPPALVETPVARRRESSEAPRSGDGGGDGGDDSVRRLSNTLLMDHNNSATLSVSPAASVSDTQTQRRRRSRSRSPHGSVLSGRTGLGPKGPKFTPGDLDSELARAKQLHDAVPHGGILNGNNIGNTVYNVRRFEPVTEQGADKKRVMVLEIDRCQQARLPGIRDESRKAGRRAHTVCERLSFHVARKTWVCHSRARVQRKGVHHMLSQCYYPIQCEAWVL